MTTATVPTPVLDSVEDDEPWHIYCCDPDIALCGEELEGDFGGFIADDGVDDCCRLCVFVEEECLPCPVIGCAG